MSSALLDRSLDDIAMDDGGSNDRRRSGRGSGRGAGRGGRGASMGRTSSYGNRSAPYSRPYTQPDVDGSWKHDLFKTDKLDYGGETGDGDQARSRQSRDDGGHQRRDKRELDLLRDREARSTKLRITNLHYEVSEKELETLFVQIGPLAPPAGRDPNPAIKHLHSEPGRHGDAACAERAGRRTVPAGPNNRTAGPYSLHYIQFDASGRSMGEATVTYESESDASRAKEAFDNALAKGERIKIEYDFTPSARPRRPRNDVFTSTSGRDFKSGAANSSLLARMGNDTIAAPRANGDVQYASSIGREAGRGRVERGGHDSSRGRGSRGTGRDSGAPRGRGAGRLEGGRSAVTAEDLDRELEAFMKNGSAGPANGDAEMA